MKQLKAVLAGKILTPLKEIPDGVVLMEDGRIKRVGSKSKVKVPSGAEVIDHQGETVVPGFVDVHTHGAAGHDFMEKSPEAVLAVARFLARHGVTGFLASTVTASVDDTVAAARNLCEVVRAQRTATPDPSQPQAAELLGIHFEGPFISTKRLGAQSPENVHAPSEKVLQEFLDAADGTGVAITLAPEVEGGMALLEYASRHGLKVSIGHSDATFEEAERAVAAGATHATHTFNAMRPFSHRDPGIIAAVLTDNRIFAELICDGIHVAPGAVRLLARCKGLDRVVLISDAISGAGMPDGQYFLGNADVDIVDGVCRTRGGALAGSTASLDTELRNLMNFTGHSYAEVLPSATFNPARLLGLEKRKGVIAPGADADLVALDSEYRVVQTYVKGQPVI
jgi:N-acetylglucosamine-6-phosphate deacetylase